VNWEKLDWEILDRLRDTFLSDQRSRGPYWHTISDLEAYDLTYGERIGWKWDAVLSELSLRGWKPPARPVILDWGCGSGIAGRRVVEFLGAPQVGTLLLHDHSPLAVEFAGQRARQRFPELAVARATARDLRGSERIGILVLSHVLNELDEVGKAELGELLARADTVLWVEPGTHEVSRALVEWREKLRGTGFNPVAPCPHGAACGLRAAGNERHWCHFFAAPPPQIFADSDWVKFGQRAGIDLRSLPYSFLVLDRRESPLPAAGSRILGEPRIYKGYAKIFNCSANTVEELMLQQRADRDLFKSLKRTTGPLLYRWTRDGDRINGAEKLYP
jgi:SAM-dependent methyltransferase